MTSCPSIAALIVAVLAIVLGLLGGYAGGYFWLGAYHEPLLQPLPRLLDLLGVVIAA